MNYSYEICKLKRNIVVVGSMLFIIYAAFCAFIIQSFNWKFYALTGLFTAFVVIIYFYAKAHIVYMSREIGHINDIMTDILYNPDNVPVEEYKPGDIGCLYTNLYRLVMVLKQSNMKEQEEKLFLRDIISDISHQLKTPLSSLSVFFELLSEKRVIDEGKKQDIINEAQNQISRMEWMVLSMLKLARIEAGAIQFENKGNNISSIIDCAVDGVAYLTNERNQRIDISVNENAVLMCDGDWLAEALINLLKNASDYSDIGSGIIIETEVTPMFTRIYVKDEGVGISEADQKNIFKRFYRVNNDVNPNSVGIGLSLAKSIIEGMGGRISVRSEIGKYTHFIITFAH